MKKYSLKIIVVLLVATVLLNSCATKKKYGCPSHISFEKIFNF